MERKMLTLQPKVCMLELYITFTNRLYYFTAGYRTSGGVCGEVLEYGVGVWTTHYCHAHTVCGGWKGMNVTSKTYIMIYKGFFGFHLDQVCSVLARKAT